MSINAHRIPRRAILAAIAALSITVLASPAGAFPMLGVGDDAVPAPGPPPTFTTLDPANTSTSSTLSGGNLTLTGNTGSGGRSLSVGCVTSGTYHFEAETLANGTNDISVGVANPTKALGPGGDSWPGGADSKSTGIFPQGGVWTLGPFFTNTLTTFHVVGDKVAVDLDATNHLVTFTSGAATSASFATPTGTLCAYAFTESAAGSIKMNFGASPWAFTPPPGYVALPPS
jgi:hypothetical protein